VDPPIGSLLDIIAVGAPCWVGERRLLVVASLYTLLVALIFVAVYGPTVNDMDLP
jgi:hypothetical protein